MTANHPEDLVARLKETAGKIATSAQDGDAELWASAEAGLWDAATAITSLVGERDALRTALIAAAGRAAGGGLSDDVSSEFLSHVPGEVAATIRNRDETIAALRTALGDIIDYVHVESGTQLSPDGTVDNLRLRLGNDRHSIRIWDGRNSWITAHLNILGSYIERARALASPHQEGTEPK